MKENSPFLILEETNDWFCIEKPAGVSVHNDSESVISRLPGSHPVHRIDKETSGCLLLAKNESAAKDLQLKFSERSIEKQYLAISFGGQPIENGLYDYPLSSKPGGLQNIEGPKPLLEASTYVLSSTYNDYFAASLLKLETGRIHQIRKHLALIKRPIVGDPRYSLRKSNQRVFKLYSEERMFLHSYKMSFAWNNQKYEIESPVPANFLKLMPKLIEELALS